MMNFLRKLFGIKTVERLQYRRDRIAESLEPIAPSTRSDWFYLRTGDTL